MKNRNIIILLTATFIAGIIFAGGTFFAAKKTRKFIQKVMQKIDARRIASIPKAKEPLVICDFEKENDLDRWEHNRANIEISPEHSTSGRYSARLTYQAAQGASSVKMEKYFGKELSDWSRYETLVFDMFNPNRSQERVILNIKDTGENRAKINISLNPNATTRVTVDISELWSTIKPSAITQFNLLLWDNPAEKAFYLDNIRLLPEGAIEKKRVDITAKEFLPKPQEPVYATGDYFAFNSYQWEKIEQANNANFVQIPLTLSYYLTGNTIKLPFSGGVPFGKGEVKSLDKVQLVDNNSNVVPFQIKPLSNWPDQSIKWALLTLKSTASSIETQKYFLRYGADIAIKENKTRLKLQDAQDEFIVDTGAIRFSLSKKNFYLFNNVWIGNDLISSKGDLVLMHKGKEYHSHLDKNYSLTVEEEGPLRVCLKAKGWFTSDNGEKYCQFITRVYAYEGESFVNVQHTFVYTGYPENKFHYLYQGKRLPPNETIEAVYLKTPFSIPIGSIFTFAADSKTMQGTFSDTVDSYQDKFDRFRLTKSDKVIISGSKMSGWLDISANGYGITLGVKNFWQQFPKGIRLDKEKQCIVTSLWPRQAGELDLKTTQASAGPDSASRGSAFGLAKTHEIFIYFHKGDYKASGAGDVAQAFLSDGLITAAPEWISATRVLGRLWQFDKRLGAPEYFLAGLFSWAERQIDNFGWYGMIDFGDTLSWYRNEDDEQSYDDWGWHPIGRWGWFNCEGVGTHSGALIQFLRTCDLRYFRFGANLARHIMDIDTCHYNSVDNDRRLKGVIPDAYSRVGSMHRHNGNHWGDRNDETSHTNVYGLLLYYYITGDGRARDVINEIGEFFLEDRVNYYGHPDIAPQRSIANALWGDVNLYELTGDKRYKIAADKWANILYVGQRNDGAWAENYNPVKQRWEGKPHMGYLLGYTLPALIAYHQLTGNKAIAETLVKATDYVIKSEEYSPYVDAAAYTYWFTGDKKYLDVIRRKMDFFVGHQKQSEDPLWNGMIYQKAYYARAEEFLYRTPFAFEVLVNGK